MLQCIHLIPIFIICTKTKHYARTKFTVEEQLEQQPYDVKRRFADTAGEEIQNMLTGIHIINDDIGADLYRIFFIRGGLRSSTKTLEKDDSLALLEFIGKPRCIKPIKS
jgi:hypothetical protein